MSQLKEVFHFKILIIGESNVGKSSLMTRFVNETFQQAFLSTVGMDFKIRTLFIDGYQCKVQIWDTAGQERFQVISTNYYRDAVGALIVYDVTNAATFSRIHRWFDELNRYCADDIVKVLVGNKDDIHSTKKVVSTTDAKQYAHRMKMSFFETSARDNRNVDETFYAVTRLALDQRLNARKKNEVSILTESIRLQESKKKHRGICCK